MVAPCGMKFGPLKKFLAGQRLTCNDEAKTAVRRWFHSQPDEFYNRGISNLVLRWDKCLNRRGDYAEKLCNLRRILRIFVITFMYLILANKISRQRLYNSHS